MEINTKQAIEFVGILGVIASLLFVGLQLQLDRNVALAEIYAIRTETRSANLRSYLESENSLRELANYREQKLTDTRYALPEDWLIEQDPIIAEARRLRIEINIMSWDNWLYQSSLGLMDDGPLRLGIEENIRMDPGIQEYALRGPAITEYTRTVFEEIANKIESEG